MASQLQLAEAQFLGYRHAESGYSAKSLAQEMGLKKSEWKKIRDKIDLKEFDKQEIDELFIINPF
jgi:hypothetical protein